VDRLLAQVAEELELVLEGLGRLQTLAHEAGDAIRAGETRAVRRLLI
jgi:hypothetical protein